MEIIGIIPARYASTRFPGKPLAEIHGKSMIQRVYEQAGKAGSLSAVYVATDDSRIYEAVKQFGGEVMMTSSNHPSGTDRCQEVASMLLKSGRTVDVVVNIQGDEPYIDPAQIDLLSSCFSDQEVNIATLVKKITSSTDLFSNSVNKVIVDKFGNAIYFSRHPIPYVQNVKTESWHLVHTFYKHIGIYAYRSLILKELSSLPPSSLEKAESLEQLRWIENGYQIRAKETVHESHSVDLPEDLLKFTNSL